VDVRDRREVRDRVRADVVNRALNRVGIEEVADTVLDADGWREWDASVESEHRMAAPHQQCCEMKPDETRVSGDENSQQGLLRAFTR
jgi:hypothetical protein